MWLLIGLMVTGLLLFGYFAPGSILGKFVHGVLSIFGLSAQGFKERHALANYHAAVERRAAALANGAGDAGDYQGLIASRAREKGKLMDEAAELEEKLDLLDEEGVPDDDPRKARLGGDLMRIQGRIGAVDADLVRYGATQERTKGLLVQAKEQVIAGRRKLKELDGDLKASEAESKLSALASGLDPASGQDTMDEAEEVVRSQIDRNRGRAAVMAEVMGQSGEDRELAGRLDAKKTARFLEARRAAKRGGSQPEAD